MNEKLACSRRPLKRSLYDDRGLLVVSFDAELLQQIVRLAQIHAIACDMEGAIEVRGG